MAKPAPRSDPGLTNAGTMGDVARADFCARIGEAFLAGYPGPVAVANGLGRAVAANPEGGVLASAINSSESPALKALVADAVAAGAPQTATIHFGALRGGTTFDLIALPFDAAEGARDGIIVIGRDVTLEHGLRGALVESRNRYKDFVESSADFAWETDAKGLFAFVSPRGALGYRAADLVGRSARGLIDGGHPMPESVPFEAREPLVNVEVWLRRADGSGVCFICACVPLEADDGAWAGARGVCRDLSDAREREAALVRSLERERRLVEVVEAIRGEVERGEYGSLGELLARADQQMRGAKRRGAKARAGAAGRKARS